MGLGLGQYGLFFPNVRKWITVPLSITTHKTLTLNFPHEGHVPNAIKGFFFGFLTLHKCFHFPGKYFSFRISPNDFHSSGGSTFLLQPQTLGRWSNSPLNRTGKMASLAWIPPEHEALRSHPNSADLSPAARSTHSNPRTFHQPHCSILQQLHTGVPAFRFNLN